MVSVLTYTAIDRGMLGSPWKKFGKRIVSKDIEFETSNYKNLNALTSLMEFKLAEKLCATPQCQFS